MSFGYRIPESKQQMVFPEIEEESEEDNDSKKLTRLSLTSLLLGKNSNTRAIH